MALLAGCQFKGEELSRRREKLGGWPFRPTAMRIHPFTRVALADSAAVLEVRVELIDPQGDVTKGIGDFRFELYSGEPRESQSGRDRRLYQWTASIVSPEDNAEHWDAVTRTYRFVLGLDRSPPADRVLLLHAQFDATSGERLTAQANVEAQDP